MIAGARESFDGYSGSIPIPILTESPGLVELYFEAWRLARQHLAYGTAQNGFAERYLDEGFDGQIYQWDSCFMTLFAMYAGEAFGNTAALDNFYRQQRADGWISRVYRESDGGFPNEPSRDEPMLNPPLFAYVEWRYLQLTGDRSRLTMVLSVLDKYYRWIEKNAAADGAAAGLFYTTLLGSGMDNSPREATGRGAWVDQSAQMHIFAKYMHLLARAAGDDQLATRYASEAERLRELINDKLWSDEKGFYFDLTPTDSLVTRFTLAGLWPVFAGISDEHQLSTIFAKLRDRKKFYRPHLFPTLSADDPDYSPRGYYWRGSVWPPTNYITIRALWENGEPEFALEAASNHLRHMQKVWRTFQPDTNGIAPEQRDGAYDTLWECYSAEETAPGTRWDDRYFSRQDFVGWCGLGPINLLLEIIIGLEPDAPRDRLVWKLYATESVGVKNYRFGDNDVDLFAERPVYGGKTFRISVRSQNAFTLVIERQRGKLIRQIPAGFSTFEF